MNEKFSKDLEIIKENLELRNSIIEIQKNTIESLNSRIDKAQEKKIWAWRQIFWNDSVKFLKRVKKQFKRTKSTLESYGRLTWADVDIMSIADGEEKVKGKGNLVNEITFGKIQKSRSRKLKGCLIDMRKEKSPSPLRPRQTFKKCKIKKEF